MLGHILKVVAVCFIVQAVAWAANVRPEVPYSFEWWVFNVGIGVIVALTLDRPEERVGKS